MHVNKAEIFEFGLIAVKIEIRSFRAWPYCGAFRLGLFGVHQYIFQAGKILTLWDSRIFNDWLDEHDRVIFKVIVKIDVPHPVMLQLRLENGLFEVQFEL